MISYKGEGKYIKRTGGVGSHGHCIIEMTATDKPYVEFENGTVGNSIPKQFISSVQQGINEAAQEGVVAGYPVIGLHIKLIDGSYHDVDSKPNDFKVAAKLAFKDACSKAPMTILEPLAEIEITVPEEYMGTVIGDLNKRRARISGVQSAQVTALVPVAETLGYATELRSITQGRGSFSISPVGYDEAPSHIQASLAL